MIPRNNMITILTKKTKLRDNEISWVISYALVFVVLTNNDII